MCNLWMWACLAHVFGILMPVIGCRAVFVEIGGIDHRRQNDRHHRKDCHRMFAKMGAGQAQDLGKAHGPDMPASSAASSHSALILAGSEIIEFIFTQLINNTLKNYCHRSGSRVSLCRQSSHFRQVAFALQPLLAILRALFRQQHIHGFPGAVL